MCRGNSLAQLDSHLLIIVANDMLDLLASPSEPVVKKTFLVSAPPPHEQFSTKVAGQNNKANQPSSVKV